MYAIRSYYVRFNTHLVVLIVQLLDENRHALQVEGLFVKINPERFFPVQVEITQRHAFVPGSIPAQVFQDRIVQGERL